MKAQTTHGEKVADAGMRFAFYGRVSTEDNQDPTLSLPPSGASWRWWWQTARRRECQGSPIA